MAIGKVGGAEAGLNFNLVWGQMPKDVTGAFIGTPKKVKLEPGFALCKFTEYFIANRAGKITEWWNPVQGYGIDPGLASRQNLARVLGANPSDLVRVTSAVKENWNALTFILQARLLKPVYGFWGQCSKMERLETGQTARPGLPKGRTKNLPGYARQFYIPHLTAGHIREISRVQV